jgi:hypothetical protein
MDVAEDLTDVTVFFLWEFFYNQQVKSSLHDDNDELGGNRHHELRHQLFEVCILV